MSPRVFKELRERLLCSGIAPRHVRRYIGELEDHFDDLVDAEIKRGLEKEAAELEARARIGDDDQLAEIMLESRELRSIAARFPLLVFGFGPVAMLIAVVAAATLIEGGFLKLHLEWTRQWTEEIPAVPHWLKLLVLFWNGIVNYAAPILIAGFFFAIGIRQRMAARWIMLSLAVAAFIGAFHQIGVSWSDLPGESELSVGFGAAWPFAYEIGRLSMNIAIVTASYWMWTRYRRAVAS